MLNGEVIFTMVILSSCLIVSISASYHQDIYADTDYADYADYVSASGTRVARPWRQRFNFTNDANMTTCSSYQFQCNSGDCVNANYKCDGDQDCDDGSDEVDCGDCGNRFRCATSGRCIRSYQRCNDRQDCEDGSDEFGCDENVLHRMTEVVSDGESSILAMVSAMGIESSTKYDLFDASEMAFQAVHAFRNSSLFYAADTAYSKVRSVVRTERRFEASDEEKSRVNREAGNILKLANTFAEEANKFVMKSNEVEVDTTDEKNYSPEARMFFLQLKWYIMWSGAAYDLRLTAWTMGGPGEPGFSGLQEQAKGDIVQAIEVIKEAMDGVLDTAMDRVGYTIYKAYKAAKCLFGPRSRCSDEVLMALIPLVQDFSKNVNEAIDY